MITDRDTDRILRTWFAEGTMPLPDHVLDVVLDGIPRVRRRPAWWPRLEGWPAIRPLRTVVVVAALVIALVAGLLLLGAGGWWSSPRPLPMGEAIPLEPATYVVQDAFPFRLGLRVPAGWRVGEGAPNLVALAPPSRGASELVLLQVDSLFLDPCAPELGIHLDVGPSPDDLVDALVATPNVQASAVTHPLIDGRIATAVSLRSSGDPRRCTAVEPEMPLIAQPELYGLAPGFEHRVWAVLVGGHRLVLVGRIDDPRFGPELEAIVATIDLDAPPAPTEAPGPRESRPADDPLPSLPTRGPVAAGVYVLRVPVYGADSSGSLRLLPGPFDAVWQTPAGWFATPRGLVSDGGALPLASYSIWAVGAVHLDPCRWRSGTLGTVDPALLVDPTSIGAALTAWWPPDPDPARTGVPYSPPPGAPTVASSVLDPWLGVSPHIVLDIPLDLDLESCDDGEYRLWAEPTGEVRTAQPGERIELRIGDTDPGRVLVESAWLPEASTSDVEATLSMLDSTWVGRSGAAGSP